MVTGKGIHHPQKKRSSFLISIHIALCAFQHEKSVKSRRRHQSSRPLLYLLLNSTAGVARSLAGSIGSLVLEGTLGVGLEVLEGVLALVLALLGAAGDALVVGVGGGGTGLGTGLALGLGGLAALVGGRHFFGGVVGLGAGEGVRRWFFGWVVCEDWRVDRWVRLFGRVVLVVLWFGLRVWEVGC
jgi:hypothetical protein